MYCQNVTGPCTIRSNWPEKNAHRTHAHERQQVGDQRKNAVGMHQLPLYRDAGGAPTAGRRVRESHVRTLHMSWSRGPRGYHHGNLKEALIRAALELIAEKGSAGFTFAEAARWAGVSPAAPYRHFRDRDDLLIDVARRGFDAFTQVLERAWGDGRPNPSAA